MSGKRGDGLYFVHLSIHGLVRSMNIEMGANPDTGGQVGYVVELCSELGSRQGIFRTELISRLIKDSNLSDDYSKPQEKVGGDFWIIRLPFGPSGYLPKENLWPHLDRFVDGCLDHFKKIGRIPDIVHGHYADAGYVGSKLSQILGVPFVFTGHSLGRSKLRKLLEVGLTVEEADIKYNILRRIEAEEESLVSASLVVASTKHEVDEQYSEYDHYLPMAMRVIPPGVNFMRFQRDNIDMSTLNRVMSLLGRFLRDMSKPIVLAIARADEKKNLDALVKAYAGDSFLKSNTNLVIVAGQRDKLYKLESGPHKVWTTLLNLLDDEDLYGTVAFPKKNVQEDIPAYMALAKLTHGVFVNPALTEPFGLTLLEAGAAGLPVVTTNDGGPVEIIQKCGSGYLVDPLNIADLAKAIKKIIMFEDKWTEISNSAVNGVRDHYSWESHVSTYLKSILPLLSSRLVYANPWNYLNLKSKRCLFTDLIDPEEHCFTNLEKIVKQNSLDICFWTRHPYEKVKKLLDHYTFLKPYFIISSMGSELHVILQPDPNWIRLIDCNWDPEKIEMILNKNVDLVETHRVNPFLLSISIKGITSKEGILKILRKQGMKCNVIAASSSSVYIVPMRCCKWNALRYIVFGYGLSADLVVCSGYDSQSLRGEFRAISLSSKGGLEESLEDRRFVVPSKGGMNGLLEGLKYFWPDVVTTDDCLSNLDS